MKIFVWLLWVFVPVCSVAGQRPDQLPVDAAAEKALLEAAGSAFQIRRTPHFIIAYNTENEVLDALVQRIEGTYASIERFNQANDIGAKSLDKRLEVIFYNQRREFDRYSKAIGFDSKGAYGVYYQVSNRSAFINMFNDPDLMALQRDIDVTQETLDQLEDQLKKLSRRKNGQLLQLRLSNGQKIVGTREELEKNTIDPARKVLSTLDAKRKLYSERINLTVVQHEVTHQVMFNVGVHVMKGANPVWLVEGLATQFESPPTRQGAGIGKANQLRLRDLRQIIGQGDDRKRVNANDFADAVRTGKLIPPRELVSNPTLFQLRGDGGAHLYAASWGMVHYLQRRKTKEFGVYLDVLASRKEGQEFTPQQELDLFELHFGPLDETFIKRWGSFITSIPYRATDAEM